MINTTRLICSTYSMKKYSLFGNSGCNIELISKGGKTYVRKYSANFEYNDRLKKQCEKQKTFTSEYFDTPHIYSSGMTKNNLFWFDMEYISGITLSKYIGTVPLSEIKHIIDIFSKVIPEKYDYDPNAKEFILGKIKSLKSKMCGNLVYIEYLEFLEKYDWGFMIQSTCHGDFTLENMLISDEKIYLIDFLDSFYDSWMIDYAKILQDVDLGWSYRYAPINVNLKIRLLIMKRMIHERIKMLNDGDKILDTIYHLLLLGILRIIPYIKDDFTEKFIYEKSKNLYNLIGGRI